MRRQIIHHPDHQTPSPLKCSSPYIQQKIAQFEASIAAAIVIPSIFTSIFVGTLSDEVGRKPILAVCIHFEGFFPSFTVIALA
jgi:MFS family permease